jgi:ferrous iron transport protein B
MSVSSFDHALHRHPETAHADGQSGKSMIVLAGNPNVGKSVVFNYLSGIYVDVSNFPGTTVEVSKASYLSHELFDTPGIYGVSSFNDEEIVARDIILGADIVVNVVDAVHLERDLFLTQQLIDMGLRVGVVVNMIDEARRQHLSIDLEALSQELGTPVIGTVAVKKHGLDAIHELIRDAREGNQDPELHSRLHELLAIVGSQSEAMLILEGDRPVAARHGLSACSAADREAIYIKRRNRVNGIIARVVGAAHARSRVSSIIGRLSVNPVAGFPILALVLYLMYLFVGVFIAQELVDITENDIGKNIIEYHIKEFVAKNAATTVTVEILGVQDAVVSSRTMEFPEGTSRQPAEWNELHYFGAGKNASCRFKYHNPWLVVFFGEFGAVTMTLTYLLFLLLPLVLGFYVALSMLEDSGYLPRIATLVDRALRIIGLNGRAVIPLILGFGCVTMATITTRLLGTQREKTIATTILQLAIPCSAQLGVIAALLAAAGVTATLIYVGIIFTFLVLVGTILDRSLPGRPSPLLLDLPPMRLPRWNNVMQKTFYKTYFFMKEASPWFFVGALVVSVLQVTGALDVIQTALQPIVVTWLKLPREAATAFVMGLVRRDFGAAGLYSMALSPFQVVAALVTITLFVPCIASLIVMLKERGAREGLIIWIGSLALAIGIGGLVAQILV